MSKLVFYPSIYKSGKYHVAELNGSQSGDQGISVCGSNVIVDKDPWVAIHYQNEFPPHPILCKKCLIKGLLPPF